MTDRFTDLSDPAWLGLFHDLSRSWFRLETLQAYAVDYEAEEFERFLATGRINEEPTDWQRMITAHTQAGRRLQRVHVVQEPLSDYLRYELAIYAVHAQAGEEIRLIPTPGDQWPGEIPRGLDFWLFDDHDVWSMEYDAQGHFLAAQRVGDPEMVTECRRIARTALDLSIPLPAYRSRAA